MSDLNKLDDSVDNIMNGWNKETKKTKQELIKLYGKLLSLKDLKVYIEMLQESLTCCLQMNGLNTDKDCEDLMNDLKTTVDVETQTEEIEVKVIELSNPVLEENDKIE